MNIATRMILYDFCYSVGDMLIKLHNPCKICKLPNGEVICTVSEPCCFGCEYLGPEGCTTKCLVCKLSLCSSVMHDNYIGTILQLRRGLTILRKVGRSLRLFDLREPKSYTRNKILNLYNRNRKK